MLKYTLQKNLVALIESAFDRFSQYVYSKMDKLEFLWKLLDEFD